MILNVPVKVLRKSSSSPCAETRFRFLRLTEFQIHRKSLIQHCERSELHLHFLGEQKLIKNSEKTNLVSF